MAETVRLALMGFGNVGQAFAQLLLEKESELLERYDLIFKVTGVTTFRHGTAIADAGLDLQALLDAQAQERSLSELDESSFKGDSFSFLRACPADVLIETTPVNPQSGQPALDHIREALMQGWHAVTANKGPVVYGYERLNRIAAARGLRFMFESAVMDGAPIFSLFRAPLAGAKLLGFEGILNSCTNLLLERMEAGESLEEAIAYGASIGITETDPSNDVDGWDASIKVAALATVLMDHPLTPLEVDRTGIRGISPAMIAEAKAAGERWKLVCTGGWQDGEFLARVHPQRVGPDSPFYTVSGTSSFVTFHLDVLPGLGILESDPSPKTTAFGLLADLLYIYRNS